MARTKKQPDQEPKTEAEPKADEGNVVDVDAFKRQPGASVEEVFEDPRYDAGANGAEHPDVAEDRIRAAGGKVQHGPARADDDEDDEDQPKAPPAWSQAQMLGLSEVPEAINFPGILTGSGGRAGTVDVGFELKVRGAGVPDLVAAIAGAVGGKQPYTVRFAGQLVGHGAVVRSYRGAADADGNSFCDVLVRLPQTYADEVGRMNRFLKKGAILALEPDQLNLDLTAKA